jgi:lipoprotein-anchoring transpeptidase ErfK/SrfK
VSEGRKTIFLSSSFVPALVAAVVTFLLVVPAARSDEVPPLAWTSPTPASHTRFTVDVGKQITINLTAATDVPFAAVHIAPTVKLPSGAHFNSSDGGIAKATFRWKPARTGTYALEFAASSLEAFAPSLRYVIRVKELSYTLSAAKSANWTFVLKKAVVRTQPKESSRAVTTLAPKTGNGTQNLVLALEGRDMSSRETWYRVRLAILPNNSTGWVRSTALGELNLVTTHLYIDRAHKRATLKRRGRTVFQSQIGIGLPYWPTPRGEFYIISKFRGFGDPFYGPIAFGTSARSPVLTDWPGGGFVGVHGTSLPQLIPGAVSHGCVRMVNSSILKLERLMPVGTPMTVR